VGLCIGAEHGTHSRRGTSPVRSRLLREVCGVESLLAVTLATYAGTALDNLLVLTILRATGGHGALHGP
jgi:hypothetical protein